MVGRVRGFGVAGWCALLDPSGSVFGWLHVSLSQFSFQIFDSQPVWPLATRGNAVQRAMVRAQDADCSSRLVAMVVGTKGKQ